MAYAFDADQVEDGTGKSGALVYGQPTATAAWLVDRNMAAFNAASDALQRAYALEATEEAEDILVVDMGFRGVRVNGTEQSRIFPTAGAYDSESRLMASDAIPSPFLEAWRLIQEEKAAGTWMLGRQTLLIEEHPDAASTARVKYARGRGAFMANHPDILMRLRRCLPASRRAAA